MNFILKYYWLFLYFLILLDNGGVKTRTTCFILCSSLVYLCMAIRKKQYLYLMDRKSHLGTVLIFVSGTISIMVGIDRGESVYGFLRLIAILVACIAIWQMEDDEKKLLLSKLPLIGIMMMVCCIFHNSTLFHNWVSRSGRLSGVFQYSNTMALFLLVGIAAAEYCPLREKRITQMILAAGLFGTGSRTAFVLLCGYLLFRLIKYGGKSKWICLFVIGIAGTIWVLTVSGKNLYGFGRFLRLGAGESTFQGRLLYWEDACRMLLKHPFGLGYMGYFYLQQAEQTGVYSVRFVHNEWLQWLLDYGILAGFGGAIFLIGRKGIRKLTNMEKEMLGLIALYSFFDFHLQFWSILFLLLLLVPKGNRKCFCRWDGWKKYPLLIGASLSVFLLVSAVLADYYAGAGNYRYAVKWNPFSAQYKQDCLLQMETLEEADNYADELLEGNQYLYVPYYIKSNEAARKRRLDAFIENRKKVLKLRKYKIEEYEEYFEILLEWYVDAYRNNDISVLEQCREAMQEIPVLLNDVKRETNVRAYKIREKPALELKKEYLEILNSL